MSTKNTRKFSVRSYKLLGFTLVELIVTITILAILSVIGFISFAKYQSESRNSARSSDLANVSKALELFMVQNGDYPVPDNAKSVTFSGGELWTQWVIGQGLMQRVWNISGKLVDPRFNAEYTYSRLSSIPGTSPKRAYSLAGVIEHAGYVYNTPLAPTEAFADGSSSSSVEAYVKGNYNGVLAKTITGSSCATVALPSILLASIPSSGKLEDAGSGSLIVAGKTNLPPSYEGTLPSETSFTGGFFFHDYGSDSEVVLSSSCALPTDPIEIGKFFENIQNVYEDSELKNDVAYTTLISTSDATSRIQTGNALITDYLGGTTKIAADTVLPSYYCASPQPNYPNSTRYNPGSPTTFEQAWTYSNVDGACTFACQAGFVWDSANKACVLDQCDGDVAILNGHILGSSTQAVGQPWTYGTAPGVCVYECNAGYTYSSGTNKCEPDPCAAQTKVVGFSPNDHTYEVPAMNDSESHTVNSNPKTIIGGNITFTQSFTCSRWELALSSSEITNAPNCDMVHYDVTGNTCTSKAQVASCGTKPANTIWNSVSSITQTWDGSAWMPNPTVTYNPASSTSECHYVCDTGYHTEDGGASCVSDTRSCTIANGNGSQSWNGAAWGSCVVTTCNSGYVNQANTCIADVCGGTVPVNGTSNATSQTIAQNWAYNTTAGVCTFKCNPNYTWNGTNACVANTQTFTCGAKPANSSWNTVGSYTQTWDGSTWFPVNSTVAYNITPSTTSCRYSCNADYHTEDGGANCVSDTRSCTIANGVGSQTWNTGLGSWNGCALTSCNSGYTASSNACVPNNCSSSTQTVNAHSYSVGALNHGLITNVDATVTISNGSITYTQGFRCDYGAITTNGSESSSPTCNSGYSWNGSSCAAIVNGACGSANGTNAYTAPSANLCANGTTPTTVSGSGPWTWGCNGLNGGTNTTATACSAQKSIDGGWSAYGSWGSCSASCGGGTQTQTRTCTNPAPANGGANCSGLTTNTQACNTQACVTYSWQSSAFSACSGETGSWSYGLWGSCSESCGGGTQSRSASCVRGNNGSQSRTVVCKGTDGNTYADSYCSGVAKPATSQSCTQGTDAVCGSATTSQSCNTQACPVNCSYTTTGWSACSASCGGGVQYYYYSITSPAANGGSCPVSNGQVAGSQACNTQGCPVNCGYTYYWSSSCDGVSPAGCGNGTQYAYYSITSAAANGGSCPVYNGQVAGSQACTDSSMCGSY